MLKNHLTIPKQYYIEQFLDDTEEALEIQVPCMYASVIPNQG